MAGSFVVSQVWVNLAPESFVTGTFEGGIVETATLYVYALAIFVLLGIALRQWNSGGANQARWIRHPFALSICIGLLAARELDWHKQFTSRDVFKTKFYVDSEIAATEKLIVGVLMLAIVGTVAFVIRRYREDLIERLRLEKVTAIATVTALGLMVASKGLDSVMGAFFRAGVDVSQQKAVARGIEEISELMIPVMMTVAITASLLGRLRATESLGQGEDVKDGHRTAA